MPDKCVMNPDMDCKGLRRADEVASEVKRLDEKLDDFRQNVSETNARFGGRIGKLEAREEVREEQYQNIREKLENISRDVISYQRDNKDSIAELRKEHKESMAELRKGNNDILNAVTPLKHRVQDLEHLSGEVEELKEKPAKRWDGIVEKVIGLVVTGVVAYMLARIGFQ